ncbi:MAG: nitronate monooxygenase [Pseudomonadota bacterium]
MKDAGALFEIDIPVIQAPMAGVQDSALAVAVSTTGALGSLPCAMLSAQQIEAELATIQRATSKPVNINFFCHQPKPYDQRQADTWIEALMPHLQQYDIAPQSLTPGAGRSPFSHDLADVIEPFSPAVISFHFGLPDDDLLARVKAWGTCVISSATTVAEAQWLAAKGVDAIIAQGLEAGGHRGMFLNDDLTTQSGTFALLPQIISSVDVPVIAAGGISTAAGVAAALSMGAVAVQMGTAFLLCDEARTSAVHRQQLQSETSRHTAITNVFSGKPARSIVNKAVSDIGPLSDKVMDFPHTSTAIGALRAKAEAGGAGDYSPLWCGQNASGCRAVTAAQQLQWLYQPLS